MSNNDKKQIIDRLFGFSILNDMAKSIKEERRNLKIDLDSFDRELKQINENMTSVQMKLNQLLAESKTKNKEKIKELKEKLIQFDENKNKLEEAKDKIYLEVEDLNKEFLYISSLASGVGSNDIGLDRGQLGGERLVKFIKAGNKLLLIQPNLKYRANTENQLEEQSVKVS